MLAQSLLSVPPAPGWIVIIAFLSSFSPLSIIEISRLVTLSSSPLLSSKSAFMVWASFSAFANSKSSLASFRALFASLKFSKILEILLFSLPILALVSTSLQKAGSLSKLAISSSLAFISSGFMILAIFEILLLRAFKSSLYS